MCVCVCICATVVDFGVDDVDFGVLFLLFAKVGTNI